MSQQECIFCRIARGEIPARKIHEDEDVVAFHDIHPVAPVHFLVIPRAHVPSLAECDASHAPMLGKLFAAVPQLAREQGCADGFRTIVNTGRVGRQEVYHLHVHVLGGPAPLPAMLRRD
jgi:histidine triad (HIT) family protein